MKDLIFSIALAVICVLLAFFFAYAYALTGNRLFLAFSFVWLTGSAFEMFTIAYIMGW